MASDISRFSPEAAPHSLESCRWQGVLWHIISWGFLPHIICNNLQYITTKRNGPMSLVNSNSSIVSCLTPCGQVRPLNNWDLAKHWLIIIHLRANVEDIHLWYKIANLRLHQHFPGSHCSVSWLTLVRSPCTIMPLYTWSLKLQGLSRWCI